MKNFLMVINIIRFQILSQPFIHINSLPLLTSFNLTLIFLPKQILFFNPFFLSKIFLQRNIKFCFFPIKSTINFHVIILYKSIFLISTYLQDLQNRIRIQLFTFILSNLILYYICDIIFHSHKRQHFEWIQRFYLVKAKK